MTDFNPGLNEDQITIQKWVHDFAEDVMRPVAHEWDEREEFPWPVVQEAAQIGLYGWEFLANAMFNDPTGLTMPVAIEEMFWGDAGLGMAIMGSGLAAAGIAASGSQDQVMEWVPQCYGTPDKVQLGAFAASEPDAGSDVGGYRTSAKYDAATDEWVLNGTKAWITNGGIADIHVVVAVVAPELKTKGHASFIVPPGTKGLSMGQKYKKHGIRASHTAEVVLDDVRVPGRCLLGGKEKLDERLARVRRRRNGQLAGRNADIRSHSANRWCSGARRSSGRVRVLARLRQRARSVRSQDHHESVDRVHAGRHGHRDRSDPTADLACCLARQAEGLRQRRRLDGQAQGRPRATWVTERAIQILGGYGYTREYPVERWHRDAKIHDIFEGTEQIQQLVISRAISGCGSSKQIKGLWDFRSQW